MLRHPFRRVRTGIVAVIAGGALALALLAGSAPPGAARLRADDLLPARLVCTGPDDTVRTGPATITATLTGEDNAPLVGRELHWTAAPLEFGVIPSAPTTDENGVVISQFLLPADLGIDADATVVASFDGDETYGAVSCAVTFRISSPGLPPPPAPAATASPTPTTTPPPSPPIAARTCTDRCTFTGTGTIVTRFYLTSNGATLNPGPIFTRNVSFDFQISVQGGQVSGQGAWMSTFTGDCALPPQADALTVSGQLSGAVLHLTLTNTGPLNFSAPDCPILANLRFNRFVAGQVLIITVDAQDGATGSTSTYPGIAANIISFSAQVLVRVTAGP